VSTKPIQAWLRSGRPFIRFRS